MYLFFKKPFYHYSKMNEIMYHLRPGFGFLVAASCRKVDEAGNTAPHAPSVPQPFELKWKPLLPASPLAATMMVGVP